MSLPLLISFYSETSRRIFEVFFSQNWAKIATNTANTERTAGSVVVQRVVDDICDIDPTSISRSICVSNSLSNVDSNGNKIRRSNYSFPAKEEWRR